MTMRDAETAVTCKAAELDRKIRKYLSAKDHIPEERIPLYRRGKDNMWVLSLQVWAERYEVGLACILDCLLDHFFNPAVKRVRTPGTIGVKWNVLCGDKSQQYLEEEILRHPEYVQAERQRLRESLIYVKPTTITEDSPEDFGEKYQKDVLKKRQLIASKEQELNKRPWRRNPWR